MPIYEFACPDCRKIFSFLSKTVNPSRLPTCPKCGNKQLVKQMSTFAMTSGGKESAGEEGPGPMADMDDPRMERAMSELERDMARMDENNPRHMAHLMKKMKDMMPAGSMPREIDIAIKRLEAGEDPEKIEADMGDVFGEILDGGEGQGGSTAGYSRDSGLYDY